MKNIFKYVLTSLALLPVSFAAFAQHEEGGVTTSKNVTGPDANGLYTVTLEAFATGGTTIIDNTKPADIVLVLDVSGSMNYVKGDATQVSSVTYNQVAAGTTSYFYRHTVNNQTVYDKIYARSYEEGYYYTTTYYELYYSLSDPTRITRGTDPNNVSYSYNVYTGTSRIDELKKAVEAFIDEI